MICFLVWPFPETAMGVLCITASWEPYHARTTRCDHSPCAELRFFTPHELSYSTASHGDRQKNKNKKSTVLPTLAVYNSSHAVIFTASLLIVANATCIICVCITYHGQWYRNEARPMPNPLPAYLIPWYSIVTWYSYSISRQIT